MKFFFFLVVVYLGFGVGEQEVKASDLQQHVLTPHSSHLLQQLQTLHTVGDGSQLLPVQVAGVQVLPHRCSRS